MEPLRPDLTDQHGSYPLKIAIYGGGDINYGGGDINDDSDENWLIFLKDTKQVEDLSAAMDVIDEAWLSERYWSTSSAEIFPEYGEEDREYTREYFTAARDFLKRMAAESRAVVFIADH